MASAQRTTQLQSIVNELTARVAADPTNTDLPPLLAAAQAELTDLTLSASGATGGASGATGGASGATAAAPSAAEIQVAAQIAAIAAEKAADKVAADKKAAATAAAAKAATATAAAAKAATATAAAAPAAAKSAPAARPSRPSINIKPMPPTVPEGMRPNPAPPRPMPVAGSSRSGA